MAYWRVDVAGGEASVTYLLSSDYSLSEVYVRLGCQTPTNCAPGPYGYGQPNLGPGPFTTGPVNVPTFPGVEVGFIVHSAVDSTISVPAGQADTFICSAPKDTGYGGGVVSQFNVT